MQNSNIKIRLGEEIELHLTDTGEAVIDANAIRAFTCGHCHSLALAIHRETGWPIIGMGGVFDSPYHCVVYCPSIDDYIDIEGPGARERYPYGSDISVIAPGQVPKLYRYLDPDVEQARPFAQKVLQMLPIKAMATAAGAGTSIRL